MQIRINGELREVSAGMSVADMVATMEGDPRGIAIERNREIVPKSAHSATLLEDGDELEVVQFVGGG
ncbi:MAG: sulfur carrier protein ThiS [Pseudomonadota bacterium]